MEVTQTPDGRWTIVDAGGNVLATRETNAEAWKAYDRLAMEPTSPKEGLTDFLLSKRGFNRL